MAIPHVVALYQWLRGKSDISIPILNDYFAQEELDEVMAQSKFNHHIFARIARLKAFGENPNPNDLKTAWFTNSEDYDGLADFVKFIRGQNEQAHHNPLQVTLIYLLQNPETAINPLNAFNMLFLTWLNVYPKGAIAWYENDDIQKTLLSTRQEIHLALGRELTKYFRQEAHVLFASVANPIGLIPLFAEYYDNPQRLATFILCLLEQGTTLAKRNEIADKIIESGLLHEFLLTHAGFMDDVNNRVKQFYDLLSTYLEAQPLVATAKGISLMDKNEANKSFEFYSLDGADHFEGCGLVTMPEASSKEELRKLDKAQYILTDQGLIYYNKTTDELQTIALDGSQLAKLGSHFADDKQFTKESKINSLTVPQIKQITAITQHLHLKQLKIIQPSPIVFDAVPQPDAFKQFYNLFGLRFLLNLLGFYVTRHNTAAKQMLERQLNNLSSEVVSQQELVQLLNVLARENKEPLLRAVAELLQDITINALIECKNFAVFHLTPFKAGLLNKLNPTEVERYITNLEPNDNQFDHLILLRTMLLQLHDKHGAKKVTDLIFDKILNVLMNNPNLNDGNLIQTLQSVARTPHYKDLLQQHTVPLAKKLNKSIQDVITSDAGLTSDTFQHLKDAWRDLDRKLSILKEISPDLASDLSYDKYEFYVSVIEAVLAHQGDLFDLQATLSNFFPAIEEQELLLHYPEGSVSEHERTLIELLVTIENETLWVQAIQALETQPINRMNWVEQQYSGQTIFELASKQGNNSLIQYLIKENKLNQAEVNHLLRTAIAAKLWDRIKHLIYLTGANKPDLESVSEALVVATQEGQLAALLTPEPSALQEQGLFQGKRRKIELPVDSAQLLTLLAAHGEEDTIKQLIQLSPPEFLDSLATRVTVTDYSGRTFTNISAFQLMSWALDSQMIVTAMLEPLQKAFNEGYAEADRIRQELERQSHEIQTTGVNYTLNGEVTPHGERHFDFQPLIKSLRDYGQQYDKWTSEQCQEHWCHQVGMLQRLVPAHVAQHYCEEKPFRNTTLLRSLRFRNLTSKADDIFESWFPLTRDNRLGDNFAIFNSQGRSAEGAETPICKIDSLNNSEALSALLQARIQDFAELREQLAMPLQQWDLNMSHRVTL